MMNIKMMNLTAFMLNAGLCALNIGLYVAYDGWWSLASGSFCGAIALYFLLCLLRD